MIDSDKNITLDQAEDWFLPFLLKSSDGVEVDISAADIVLQVENGFTLTPGAHPNDAKGRQFHFTKAQAQSLTRSANYHVVRITAGVPQLLWSARISSTGFA